MECRNRNTICSRKGGALGMLAGVLVLLLCLAGTFDVFLASVRERDLDTLNGTSRNGKSPNRNSLNGNSLNGNSHNGGSQLRLPFAVRLGGGSETNAPPIKTKTSNVGGNAGTNNQGKKNQAKNKGKKNQAKNSTDNSKNQATPRFCRFPTAPVMGNEIVRVESLNFTIGYQCAGEAYNECADRAAHVFNTARKDHSPSWGVQGAEMVKPNTSILFMGNSHTRQIIEALVCQYREEILETDTIEERHLFHIRLRNNVTITASINNPQHHSTQFEPLLQQQLGRSFASFDVVVLGQFNSLEDNKDSTFYRDIVAGARALNSTLDFDAGFSLSHFASVYQGPIVQVTSFRKESAEETPALNEWVAEERNTTGRDNILVLSGIQYVPDIGQCTFVATGGDIVSVAGDLKWGHRCIGGAGGHPDLIAWDVVDALHQTEY